ncbi:MAG: Rid family detoxifying hydrolase [Gammaproteobacteria bacterium]|jgi:reactive intermediate/imine deaminase|nr:Rid family detoxifying hydrolase [Gammaproteobacteria bacterium]
MEKIAIHSSQAPSAIGCYSQGIKFGNIVFLSGQIPLDAATMQMVEGPIEIKIAKVLDNLKTVAEAAGGSLNDLVQVTVYLIDLAHFQAVNNAMAGYFEKPYPARAVIGVASLPKGAEVEIAAVMALS